MQMTVFSIAVIVSQLYSRCVEEGTVVGRMQDATGFDLTGSDDALARLAVSEGQGAGAET